MKPEPRNSSMPRWVLGAGLLGAGVWLCVHLLVGQVGPLKILPTEPAKNGPSRDAPPALQAAPPRAGAFTTVEEQPQGRAAHGRVVGPAHASAAGALITLSGPTNPAITAVVGADGVYALSLPPWTEQASEFVIRAEQGSNAGYARFRRLGDLAGTVDLGTIVLQASFPLTIRVVHAGQAVPRAAVRVWHFGPGAPVDSSDRRVPGWTAPPEARDADSYGVVEMGPTPSGVVRVVAWDASGRVGEARRRHPDGRTELVVELREARSVLVRVLQASDGAPMPGVRVWMDDGADADFPTRIAEGLGLPVTGSDGTVTLRGIPPDRAVRLALLGPGWIWPWEPEEGPSTIPSTESEVTYRVRMLTEVALPVMGVESTNASPVELWTDDWALLRNSRISVPKTGRIESGLLRFTLPRPGRASVTARSNDGRVARFRLRPDGQGVVSDPTPIAFNPPRTITVVVREHRTRAPVPGVAVRVLDAECLPLGGPIVSGADGVARCEGLPSTRVYLACCPIPSLVPEDRQGIWGDRQVLDLSLGDQEATVFVGQATTVRLELRQGSQPVLPLGLVVAMRYVGEGLDWVVPRDLRYDAEEGAVEWTFRPPVSTPMAERVVDYDPTLDVRLVAPEMATVRHTVALNDRVGALVRVALEVSASGRLDVLIKRPPTGRYSIRLERCPDADRADGAGNWEPWPEMAEPRESDSYVDTYAGLPGGLYRLHETLEDWVSDIAPVRPGTRGFLAWDLTRTGWVRGEIRVPDGIDPASLDVRLEGERSTGYRMYRRLVGTNYQIQVPGDRPVTIVPVHPLCRPAANGGRVTLTEPNDGIVLRLELQPP